MIEVIEVIEMSLIDISNLVYSGGLKKSYDMSVEIFEDGYRSEIHVYDRGADSYTCMADSFTDVIGSLELGDYYEYQGCVFSYDDSLESIEMYIPIREFNTRVMASRVFDVGKFMRRCVDM